jgi:hypothetical protein
MKSFIVENWQLSTFQVVIFAFPATTSRSHIFIATNVIMMVF